MIIPRPLRLVFLIPWLCALGCLVWLFFLRFPPSGQIHFSFPFNGQHVWLDPFLPAQRVLPAGTQADGWVGQRVFDEPVYAGARVPGIFDKVTVTFEARSVRQPLIDLGILRDAEAFSFETHPLWSEELSRGWHQVIHAGVAGYVKDGVSDAELTKTNFDHQLVWDAPSSTSPLWMDQEGPERVYTPSLRGAHDFYVVPTNGNIYFTFDVQDVNRSRGGKVVAFRLNKDDQTIWTDAIGTGGSRDQLPNEVYKKTISFNHLEPGVYRLSVIADDDVFIRRFTTRARHWVIGPRFYFGDTVGYAETLPPPTTVWTNSRHLVAQTFHKEGLQTVSLGSAQLHITRTHQPYPLDRAPTELDGLRQITAPQGDIRFVGDAFFSFDPDTIFFPKPRRLTDASKLNQEGVLAVITPYIAPQELPDGWYKFTTAFSLPQTEDPIKFVLSAPGIFFRGGAVDIRHVELRYERPPLSWGEWWKRVRQELRLAWHRL